MSDEPELRRTHADGNGKFYEHSLRTDAEGRPLVFDSVTTVLDAMDKPALKQWAANLAAGRAIENLPRLLAAARVEPCGAARKRDGSACQRCPECEMVWLANTHFGEAARRAREGTLVHRMKSWWIKTGETRYQRELDDDPPWEVIKPYWVQFEQFVADYGLTPESWKGTELTVFGFLPPVGADPLTTVADDAEPGWGGTLDGILRFEPTTRDAHELCARISGQVDPPAVTLVEDVKTREKTAEQSPVKIYAEVPLQLTPYRWSHHVVPKGAGVEFAMPATDGGAVLQLRPDGYEFRPVRTDLDVLAAFIGILRMYRAMREAASWVRLDAFPKPAGYKAFDPVAARKAALAAAVPDNGATVEQVAKLADAVKAVKKAAPRKRATRETAKKATASMAGSVTAQAPLDAVQATGDPFKIKSGVHPDSPYQDDIPF